MSLQGSRKTVQNEFFYFQGRKKKKSTLPDSDKGLEKICYLRICFGTR